VYYDQLLKLK
jgi:hypothetical protein